MSRPRIINTENLLGASKLVLLEGNSQPYYPPQRSNRNYPPQQQRQYIPPPPPVPLYKAPPVTRQEQYIPMAPVRPVLSSTTPRNNIIQYTPPKQKPKQVWNKPETAFKQVDNTFKQGMGIDNDNMKNIAARNFELLDRFNNDEDFRDSFIRLSEAQALAEELALQEEELEGNGSEIFSLCGNVPIAYTNPEQVKYIRPHLRKLFVDDSGMLSGSDFDNLSGEELLGFLDFIGKAVKGIGKGIGAVGKTIGKGIGAVGKFAVKNLPGIVSTAAGFIPGGGIISAGIDTVSNLVSSGNTPKQQQQQQYMQEEVYTPQELYYPPQQNNYNDYYTQPPPQNYYNDYYSQPPQQNYYNDYYSQPYYPPQQNYYDRYQSGMLRGNIFDDIFKGIKKAGEWIINPVNQRKISVLSSGAANLQTQGKYYIDNAGDIARWQQASEEAKFNVSQGSEDILKTWALPIGIGLIGILLLTSSRR